MDKDQIHGTAIAVGDRCCIITGASGSGKSTLALEIIALGATLVADDRIDLRREKDRLIASAPENIAGMIEATGVGIIRMRHTDSAEVAVVVDLDQTELRRLPAPRKRDLLGVGCPVIFGRNRPGLAAILWTAMQNEVEETP